MVSFCSLMVLFACFARGVEAKTSMRDPLNDAFEALYAQASQSCDAARPGLVIATDCGSGGTRTGVFVLDNTNGQALMTLQKELGGDAYRVGEPNGDLPETSKPFGKILDNDAEVKKHAQEMVDHVKMQLDRIPGPPECKSGVQWFIRATAGMREVHRRDSSQEAAAWTKLRDLINKKLEDPSIDCSIEVSAETIPGWKEAEYDYNAITKMGLGDNGNVMVLDLGGASTQFAIPLGSAELQPAQQVNQKLAARDDLRGNPDEFGNFYFQVKHIGNKDVFLGSFLAASGTPLTPYPTCYGSAPVQNEDTLPFSTKAENVRVSNVVGGLLNTMFNVQHLAPECWTQKRDGSACDSDEREYSSINDEREKVWDEGSLGDHCFQKLMRMWKADPFVAESKDQVQAAVGAYTGPIYAMANFIYLNFKQKPGKGSKGGVGLTKEMPLKTLKDQAIAVWNDQTNLYTPEMTTYMKDSGFGFNGPFMCAYYYFLLAEFYGLDPDKKIGPEGLNINIIGPGGGDDVKRPWIGETDSAQDMSWLPGLLTDVYGVNYYSTSLSSLEHDLHLLEAQA